MILLFVLNIVFFYLLRVLTILLLPPNTFMIVKHLDSVDYNNALELLILFIIPISFIIFYFKGILKHQFVINKPHNFYYVFIISIIANFNYLLISSSIPAISALSTYIGLILQKDFIFFLAIIYAFSFKSQLNKKQFIFIIINIIFYVSIDTLTGNKSGIFKVFFFLIFSASILIPRIFISLRLIMKLIILVPFAIYLFFVANFIRDINRNQNEKVSLSSVIDNIDADFIIQYGEVGLSQIAGRIGYLDFTTNTIKNSNNYSEIFNFHHYFGSTIDYLLPFINPFDFLRVANSLTAVEKYGYLPSNSFYLKNSEYHSDIITVFAEYYNLGGGLIGGVLLLVIFLLFFFIFFKYYFKKSENILNYNLRTAVFTITFFDIILNSFGIDWSLVTFIYMLIYLKIAKKIYAR